MLAQQVERQCLSLYSLDVATEQTILSGKLTPAEIMAKKKKHKPNATYELPKNPSWVADKFILGHDPGSRNYGLALVGLQGDSVKVFANTVLMTPVDNLVNFNAARENYLSEIASWVKLQKPNGMIAERFQTRGNGGPLIEMVSCMLGLLGGTYPKMPLKLTIASAWKNKVQKRFDVDLKEIYPTTGVQPHQLDAALIGIYGLEQGLGRDLDYDLRDMIAQVEATSLLPLKKKKEPKC